MLSQQLFQLRIKWFRMLEQNCYLNVVFSRRCNSFIICMTWNKTTWNGYLPHISNDDLEIWLQNSLLVDSLGTSFAVCLFCLRSLLTVLFWLSRLLQFCLLTRLLIAIIMDFSASPFWCSFLAVSFFLPFFLLFGISFWLFPLLSPHICFKVCLISGLKSDHLVQN